MTTKLKARPPEEVKPGHIKGVIYGRLTLLEKEKNNNWLCKCTCGNIKLFKIYNLTSGRTRSCGCLRNGKLVARRTTHGHKTGYKVSREYVSWQHMRQRCENVERWDYSYYGGRGISVCAEWGRFENFIADMGKCPVGNTLDRIDNNKNYDVDNCRWADRKTQARNTRGNKIISFNNETLTLVEWSEKINMPYHTLKSRFLRGWQPERALTATIRKWGI